MLTSEQTVGFRRARRPPSSRRLGTDFLVRDDVSAVQYVLPADPAFWVRVCKPTAPRLDISGALQGDLTDGEFREAGCAILDRDAGTSVTHIRFLDISPGVTADMSDHEFVGRRFDFLLQLVRGWAKKRPLEVREARLEIRDGCYGAHFDLG